MCSSVFIGHHRTDFRETESLLFHMNNNAISHRLIFCLGKGKGKLGSTTITYALMLHDFRVAKCTNKGSFIKQLWHPCMAHALFHIPDYLILNHICMSYTSLY